MILIEDRFAIQEVDVGELARVMGFEQFIVWDRLEERAVPFSCAGSRSIADGLISSYIRNIRLGIDDFWGHDFSHYRSVEEESRRTS